MADQRDVASGNFENSFAFLTRMSAADARGAVLRKPKASAPQPIDWDPAQAGKLSDITTRLAAERGVDL